MSSQRVAKVESLIRTVVATQLIRELAGDAARVTVTAVDASPDLRHAIVWLGILAEGNQREALHERVLGIRPALQKAVAEKTTTKFVPKLDLRLDTGGEYAAEMERLLNQI